jgi:hypothetical protein
MSTKKTLIDAADLIERRGWVQQEYGRPEYGYCLFGAVFEAAEHGDYDEPWRLLGDRTNGDPIGWNDALSRTKEDVLALLRETAEAIGD